MQKTLDQIVPFGRRESAVDGRTASEPAGFAVRHATGEAYSEEAFQYFLEIERRRSKVSNRPFLLMLIEFNKAAAANGESKVVSTDKLFSVLSQCLRETDFVGWYREGRVAGAVLTQDGEPDRDDLSDVVRRRISDALDRHFPREQGRGLQVRVYQLSPLSQLRSE